MVSLKKKKKGKGELQSQYPDMHQPYEGHNHNCLSQKERT